MGHQIPMINGPQPLNYQIPLNYSMDHQLGMNHQLVTSNYSPEMNYQPMQPVPNYQSMQPAPNYQSMQPVPNYQPIQPAPNYQPMQPAPNYQPMPPAPNYQPMQPAPNYQPVATSQPMQPIPNYQPVATSQPMQPVTTFRRMQSEMNPPKMQSLMNYSVENQNQPSLSDSCIISVSSNFLLKFILRDNQLKTLRNGQSCFLSCHTVSNIYIEIDPDYHITFKHSDKWESFDLVYAFLESKNRVFSLEESSQLSFLNSFHPSYVDDEDVTIHCMVMAFPRHSSVDKYQNMGPVELPTVSKTMPSVQSSSTYLPANYKNQKVINFIRRGLIPKLNVNMAIEIIGETKEHKCRVLTIICVEYLMKNITASNLKKILKAATDNRLFLLQERCVVEIEKCEITEKENKIGKCDITEMGNKIEKCEISEKEAKTKENKAKKNELEKNKTEKEEK